MIIICAFCGGRADKAAGAVNRSLVKGAPVYCGRACSGLARRNNISAEDAKSAKADYDRCRRAKIGDIIAAKKREAYLRQLKENPQELRERQRAFRKQRMPKHVEYCRRPEYREAKKLYDRQHLAKKHYGPFADAALALRELEGEINSRSTWLERQLQKGTLNKPIQRKRDYAKRSIGQTVRSEPEGSVVGHAQVDPEGATPTRRG